MNNGTFQAIPMFRIFDVAKAKEFYCDFLGFTADWEHRFGDNGMKRIGQAPASRTALTGSDTILRASCPPL